MAVLLFLSRVYCKQTKKCETVNMKSFQSAGLPQVSSAGLLSSCWGLEVNPAPPAGDHAALQPIHRTCSSRVFISLSSEFVRAFNITTIRRNGVISAPVRQLASLFDTVVISKVDFFSSVAQCEKRNNPVQTYATHDDTLVLIPCERCVSFPSEPCVCRCFCVATIARTLRRHFLCVTSVCDLCV